MKKLFLTMLSLVGLFGASAQTLTVCDGTATSDCIPVDGNWYDGVGRTSQMLYPSDDLTDMVGKTITGITFYASNNIGFSGGKQEISLCEVQDAAMTSLVTEGLTPAFEGTVTIDASQLIINFDTPYLYNGGNLLISFKITEAGSYKAAVSSVLAPLIPAHGIAEPPFHLENNSFPKRLSLTRANSPSIKLASTRRPLTSVPRS